MLLPSERLVHLRRAIPTRDILGVFDDEAVRHALGELGRQAQTYPGFAGVTNLDQPAMGNFDEFLSRRYGMTKDPVLFARIADIMRRHAAIPPTLSHVFDELEQLALSVS